MEFNLFKLHKKIDGHPRSWICIKGNGIKEVVNEIENRIIKENGLSREQLSKILAKKLNCYFTSFKRIFRGQVNYFPIPFIQEIIRLCNDDSYLDKLQPKIEFLKVNSASSNKVFAIKNLNEDLAKILGAFMADGSLTVTIIFASSDKHKLSIIKNILINNQLKFNEWHCKSRSQFNISITLNDKNQEFVNKLIVEFYKRINIQSHYSIQLMDEHKSNIDSFKEWIWNCFKLKPTLYRKKSGGWNIVYSNKIMARYLTNFFKVIPGPKSSTAFEPIIIKNSNLKIRKLFARGVLMFDGSFTIGGNISFETKSPYLHRSIKEILEKDKIIVGTSNKDGSYILFTYKSAPSERITFYFEKGTHKWLRVNDIFNQNNQTIEELESRYRIYSNNKVTMKRLYETIKNLGCCDREYLSEYFECSQSSLKSYLIIMKNSNLIKFSRNPSNINNKFVNNSIQVYLNEDIHSFVFDKIKNKFGTYKNLGKKLNIHKATISAWKLRKNRIPLNISKEICNLCDIDFSMILSNIKETDRKIIEII